MRVCDSNEKFNLFCEYMGVDKERTRVNESS